AEWREFVTDPRRRGGFHRSRDKPVPHQGTQCLRQHLLADPADRRMQYGEAPRAFSQCRQDQHAPAAGDVLEDLARRALAVERVTHALPGVPLSLGTYLHIRSLPEGRSFRSVSRRSTLPSWSQWFLEP